MGKRHASQYANFGWLHENFAEFSSSSSNRHSHSSGNRKKIFDDDEGEYVDYEEVK